MAGQPEDYEFRQLQEYLIRHEEERIAGMGMIEYTVYYIKSIESIRIRKLRSQVFRLGMVLFSVMIVWKLFICISGSPLPAVVILSGSMEPGLKEGDLLFVHMSEYPIRAGEIVVFRLKGRDIPFVHRVIKVHERQITGDVEVLTKGDNNYKDDKLLYARGQLWLHLHHIMGRAVGFVPYLGWPAIIMKRSPFIKYMLICTLVWRIITSKGLIITRRPILGR